MTDNNDELREYARNIFKPPTLHRWQVEPENATSELAEGIFELFKAPAKANQTTTEQDAK